MNIETIQNSFKSAVTESVRLFPEGTDRCRVFTPFHFDDGDNFVIVLRKDKNGNLIITDEGHTYMHMSYHTDMSSLKSGSRNNIIEGALEKHNVMESEGEIFANIDDIANAGGVFYSFIQCLMSITDVSYLSRERVASTFMADFRQFISETVDSAKFTFNYHNDEYDPERKYLVDCRINSMAKPLHIYAIGDDNKCRDTTIGILQSMTWDTPSLAMGIFADQEKINRKVLSRFTDVCDRQFSSLAINRERIEDYLQTQMS